MQIIEQVLRVLILTDKLCIDTFKGMSRAHIVQHKAMVDFLVPTRLSAYHVDIQHGSTAADDN